jgi:transposase
MVGKQHSSDYKMTALQHYEKSKSFTETCKIFHCKRQTLKRWYASYNHDKTLTRKQRTRGAYKVSKELVKYTLAKVKAKPDIFVSDLMLEVKEKFPDIDLSRQHLGEIIRDNNKTRKRLRHIHEPATYWGKPRDHKQEIADYLKKIKEYDINKIIALDETGIYASLHGSYGRCNLGKRCAYKTTDSKTFKKYSLLVAINSKGVVGWKLYEEGAVNSERLTSFIADNITAKYEDQVVVMDNAGFHKTQDVKKEILKKNDFLYSIPYYPRSNPIEQFFNQLKHYIKKESPISYEDIQTTIRNSLTKIKEKHLQNYFLHAFRAEWLKKDRKTRKRPKKVYLD